MRRHSPKSGPRRRRLLGLGGASLAALLAVALLPPLPQDPAYHRFADGRSLLGIPNALNVLSNIPLVVAGAAGAGHLRRRGGSILADRREVTLYAAFFAAALLTGLGSAWYHLAPDDGRLFWDRLPLAATCAAFTAAMLAERVGVRIGSAALLPLLAAGIGSVLYWRLGALAGSGDLRPYGFIHFFPLLLIPLLLLLYPPRYSREGGLWGALGLFALTLPSELLDRQLFALGQIVSGHTLKHLIAAAAVAWVLRTLAGRRFLGERTT